jgi:hypothetical protein
MPEQGSKAMCVVETRNRAMTGGVLLVPFSLILLPACLGSSGCAGVWDDVTSRDFKVTTIFTKSEPDEVLARSTDGDKRAKALRALREPKQSGGSDADQERILNLLVTAAVSDRQPLCRLAAIQSLGHFHDPRAVQGLIDAYYAVTEQRADGPGAASGALFTARPVDLGSGFTPEMTNRIQCQALTSLGETGNQRAVELLTTVVREPKAEGQGKQQATDVRIAAARALAKFPHYQATESLVHVLQTEKDVALRDASYESLRVATGKDLPPDPKAWENLLHQEGVEAMASAERSGLQKVVGYFQGKKENPLEARPRVNYPP